MIVARKGHRMHHRVLGSSFSAPPLLPGESVRIRCRSDVAYLGQGVSLLCQRVEHLRVDD